jgi:hypothetical protein
MPLTHEFFLIRKEIMVDRQFYLSPPHEGIVVIHDDIITYIWDSFMWIPTYNPGKRNFPADYGLNYHGVTIVQDGGAALLRDICLSWCTLFSLAPQTFQLKGAYTHSSSERIEEGGYEKIRCDRTELTKLLKDLANLADRALTDGYCILHIGI